MSEESKITLTGPGPFRRGIAQNASIRLTDDLKFIGRVFEANAPDTGAPRAIEIALPVEAGMALMSVLQDAQKDFSLEIPDIQVLTTKYQ